MAQVINKDHGENVFTKEDEEVRCVRQWRERDGEAVER